MPTPPKTKPDPKLTETTPEPKLTAIQVSSRTDTFRRAGFQFSSDNPTTIKLTDLTVEKLAAITGEPNLRCMGVYDDDTLRPWQPNT